MSADMMDLTDTFCQCANAPKNVIYIELMCLLELSINSVNLLKPSGYFTYHQV